MASLGLALTVLCILLANPGFRASFWGSQTVLLPSPFPNINHFIWRVDALIAVFLLDCLSKSRRKVLVKWTL